MLAGPCGRTGYNENIETEEPERCPAYSSSSSSSSAARNTVSISETGEVGKPSRVGILTRVSTSLELRDLLRDPLFALRIGESWCHMLFALRSPVFVLVGGLEGGVRADGGISVGVDLLNVVRTNTVL